MKSFLFCFGFTLVLFPWVVGFVDLMSWALLGSQITAIPWDEPRGVVLALWPLFCAFMVGMFQS